jgi:hypothetical protein
MKLIFPPIHLTPRPNDSLINRLLGTVRSEAENHCTRTVPYHLRLCLFRRKQALERFYFRMPSRARARAHVGERTITVPYLYFL